MGQIPLRQREQAKEKGRGQKKARERGDGGEEEECPPKMCLGRGMDGARVPIHIHREHRRGAKGRGKRGKGGKHQSGLLRGVQRGGGMGMKKKPGHEEGGEAGVMMPCGGEPRDRPHGGSKGEKNPGHKCPKKGCHRQPQRPKGRQPHRILWGMARCKFLSTCTKGREGRRKRGRRCQVELIPEDAG